MATRGPYCASRAWLDGREVPVVSWQREMKPPLFPRDRPRESLALDVLVDESMVLADKGLRAPVYDLLLRSGDASWECSAAVTGWERSAHGPVIARLVSVSPPLEAAPLKDAQMVQDILTASGVDCAAAAECCQEAAPPTLDVPTPLGAESSWLWAFLTAPGVVRMDNWPETLYVRPRTLASADPRRLHRERDCVCVAADNGEAEYRVIGEGLDLLYCARLYAKVW